VTTSGKDVDTEYAERVLRAVHRLWGRPVHLETKIEDERILLSFDGRENTQETL
jgi:stage V sporulation protein R